MSPMVFCLLGRKQGMEMNTYEACNINLPNSKRLFPTFFFFTSYLNMINDTGILFLPPCMTSKGILEEMLPHMARGKEEVSMLSAAYLTQRAFRAGQWEGTLARF